MRQRKPTELHKLAGTYRPDRTSAHEPEPRAGRVIMPRGVLSPSARKMWRAWAPELQRLGLLTPLDAPMFTLTCVWAGAALDAAAMLREEGIVVADARGRGMVKHRALTVLRAASVELRQLSRSFGLTPADRAGLSLRLPEGEEDIAELLVRMATEAGDGDN